LNLLAGGSDRHDGASAVLRQLDLDVEPARSFWSGLACQHVLPSTDRRAAGLGTGAARRRARGGSRDDRPTGGQRLDETSPTDRDDG